MLPEAFLERMKRQLGDEYEDFLSSLERPRAVALRFNPLKGEAPSLPFVQENVPIFCLKVGSSEDGWAEIGTFPPYCFCSLAVRFRKGIYKGDGL